jgi:hypothetical protein
MRFRRGQRPRPTDIHCIAFLANFKFRHRPLWIESRIHLSIENGRRVGMHNPEAARVRYASLAAEAAVFESR